MCSACFAVGLFYTGITVNSILEGNIFGFRDEAISVFLANATILEPLNLFFYTWRFLSTLEKEAESKMLKSFYRWLARITIILIPAGYYAVFAAGVVE